MCGSLVLVLSFTRTSFVSQMVMLWHVVRRDRTDRACLSKQKVALAIWLASHVTWFHSLYLYLYLYYYVAVRTIVLSRHGSNLARPVIIHDIIHGLIYVSSTPCCVFLGISLDGNCVYVHWGSFTSNSKSVRRAIWFTWFSEPHECIQHLAVPGGHPSNYKPGTTLLNFRDRAQTVERTPYSVLL